MSQFYLRWRYGNKAAPSETLRVGRSSTAMSAPPRAAKAFDRSIVEGPILGAVWKLAWPTVLTNLIGGLQGVVDHAMVGHFVGYTGNAAIGVSIQIFLVVITFVMSLYTGMGVLVARFTGANDHDNVNRSVYQAFLTSVGLSFGVLAPVGWFLAPGMLSLVNAAPEVQVAALPYLRIMFVGSFGMLLFFMLGGALRAAGDARTPLRLGVGMTILNIIFNVILIRGLGPIPALGVAGAALGTMLAGLIMSVVGLRLLLSGDAVVQWHRGMNWKPDWTIIRQLFKFGLPAGFQGVAMNLAGVFLLRFIGSLPESAEAQAAYAVGYTELFSLITWTSVGLMGAAAAVAGQNLGAGKPERTAAAVSTASRLGLGIAATVGLMFVTMPRVLLGAFGMTDPTVVTIGVQLLGFLSVSGFFVTVALTYTGGLQGTGDTKGPLFISIISQIIVPLGLCSVLQATRGLQATDIWTAIVLGHMTRALLSVVRFRRGRWREIEVVG
ncbi:MAG TPA: MATE family efflux transporter [Gemmatimonadales bacterium]|nr:MATE family efflux transporter [Gemmatimonadales bacterium]